MGENGSRWWHGRVAPAAGRPFYSLPFRGLPFRNLEPGRFRARSQGATSRPRAGRGCLGSEGAAEGALGARE
jgi:hypothetical protein